MVLRTQNIEIMVNKFIKHGVNKFPVSMLECQLLQKHYNFLTCKVSRDGYLKTTGQVTPTDYSPTYLFSITYLPYEKPKVHITYPVIEYNNDIHMYTDGSLCLYYPGDLKWNSTLHLYSTIVPWTVEWLIFYELYSITGKWEHPFVEHGKLKT